MKTNEENIMKTDEDRINLRGKTLSDHYMDMDGNVSENYEGEGFTITEDEKTVADIYKFIAEEFVSKIEWFGAVTDIREFGDGYLIDWTDEDGEEHSDKLTIWAEVDDEWVLVPYSDDAVENAYYE